jgi:hypothetical protein
VAGLWRRGLVAALLVALPAPARADWHWDFMPHIGISFGGDTNLVLASDPQRSEGRKKVVWGGSVGFVGPGIFGLEADFAFAPGYFQDDSATSQLVQSSRVTTLTGNVLVMTPLRWTGYSLRPYAVGGFGLIKASLQDRDDFFTFTRNMRGFDVGGGVVGFLTDRTGVRWDLRYFRTASGEDLEHPITFGGAPRLSFWRASMAVVIRR